jgi:acetoacetyl-CoA synthetase
LCLTFLTVSISGKPVKGQEGTLVVRTAFPNMPLAFLDDPAGKRYQETYFSDFDHPVFNMVSILIKLVR